ncbi:hypothetical protein [Leadbetterella byssophila]|uniref:hypothetical protein n=1 Tax=Leadbetterella byssophila TaxID=316068 RepID=UPI0039A246EF
MRYVLTFAFLAAACVVQAQKKVVNEEINITKEREVSVPKATKLTEKIPQVPSTVKEKKMNYSFFDRKPTGVEEVNFNPNVISPQDNKAAKKDDILGFDNYLKLGAGNYGRLFGELYLNTPQDRNLVYGINAMHNSASKGPIEGKLSGQSNSKVGIYGKYHQNTYEVKLDAGYENKIYHFYGFDTTANFNYTKADLRQRLNMFNFGATLENTRPKPIVDYKLTTGVNTLNNAFDASELDWATSLRMFFPLYEDKIKAAINAEAYVTHMSDNLVENPDRKRNLFRIEPAFNFDFGSFSAHLGFKVLSQSDPTVNAASSKGYPSVTLTYKTPAMVYIFGGYDGDIVRNTMRSMLLENPWLTESFAIQNTYKNKDIFLGARGELYNGISFNVKGSYGTYQDLYYFDQFDGTPFSPLGSPLNVTKFDAVYEDKHTDFFNASFEVGYSGNEIWRPVFKLDYNYYEKGKFEKPYHRPAVNARWGNTITLTDRLVSSLDFYYIGGIFARNLEPFGDKPYVKLNDIVDLNAEFTYLFTDHLAGFIKLNNIIGKNYQRYYNYHQMGINFLAGINIAL